MEDNIIIREDKINTIREKQNKGITTIILFGPGGYGKTTIAKMINDESDPQNGLIHADGDIRGGLERIYYTLLPDFIDDKFRLPDNEMSNMPDHAFAQFLYRMLDMRYNNWCIIYDNVEFDGAAFTEFVRNYKLCRGTRGQISTPSKGIVIITTKRRPGGVTRENGVDAVEIGAIEGEQAESYLQNAFGEITEVEIKTIMSATGCIALPLRMAVNIINRMEGETLADQIKAFCGLVNDVHAPMASREYGYNLYKATKATVDLICGNQTNNSTYELLMCCAMLASNSFKRKRSIVGRLQIPDRLDAEEILRDWMFFAQEENIVMHPTTQDVLLLIDMKKDKGKIDSNYIERLIRVCEVFIQVVKKTDNIRDAVQLRADEIPTAKRLSTLLRELMSYSLDAKHAEKVLRMQYQISYGVAFFYWHCKTDYDTQIEYYKHAYKAVATLYEKTNSDDLRFIQASLQCFLGPAYRQMDLNTEAINCYNQTMEMYDQLPENMRDQSWHELAIQALYNRGLAKSDKGNTTNVCKDYKKSIEIADNNGLIPAKTYRCLGIYHRNKGNYSLAEKEFRKSISLSNSIKNKDIDKDNIARCHTNLGLLYEMQGKLDNAVQQFNVALAVHTENGNYSEAKAWFYQANCLRKQKKFDEAKECLNKAAVVLFGQATDSDAYAFSSFLDGAATPFELHFNDYHWNNIDCMLFCTSCINFVLAYYGTRISVRNTEKVIDAAFKARDKHFVDLRKKLIQIANEMNIPGEIPHDVIIQCTGQMDFNKRACAVLLLACAKYYRCKDKWNQALVFAHAAELLNQSDGYKYGYEIAIKFENELLNDLLHV